MSTNFNESRHIGFAMYSALFAVCVVAPFAWLSGSNPDMLGVTALLLYLLVYFMPLIFIFLPKFLSIWVWNKSSTVEAVSSRSLGASGNTRSGGTNKVYAQHGQCNCNCHQPQQSGEHSLKDARPMSKGSRIDSRPTTLSLAQPVASVSHNSPLAAPISPHSAHPPRVSSTSHSSVSSPLKQMASSGGSGSPSARSLGLGSTAVGVTVVSPSDAGSAAAATAVSGGVVAGWTRSVDLHRTVPKRPSSRAAGHSLGSAGSFQDSAEADTLLRRYDNRIAPEPESPVPGNAAAADTLDSAPDTQE